MGWRQEAEGADEKLQAGPRMSLERPQNEPRINADRPWRLEAKG